MYVEPEVTAEHAEKQKHMARRAGSSEFKSQLCRLLVVWLAKVQDLSKLIYWPEKSENE